MDWSVHGRIASLLVWALCLFVIVNSRCESLYDPIRRKHTRCHFCTLVLNASSVRSPVSLHAGKRFPHVIASDGCLGSLRALVLYQLLQCRRQLGGVLTELGCDVLLCGGRHRRHPLQSGLLEAATVLTQLCSGGLASLRRSRHHPRVVALLIAIVTVLAGFVLLALIAPGHHLFRVVRVGQHMVCDERGLFLLLVKPIERIVPHQPDRSLGR
mmetsp:Transcript_17123/g.51254  ORF Transcript_17123/g.51254 Transcript_17123/m.51254 type:complete len:213 (+) Transcript_17123:1709-2347(+)